MEVRQEIVDNVQKLCIHGLDHVFTTFFLYFYLLGI